MRYLNLELIFLELHRLFLGTQTLMIRVCWLLLGFYATILRLCLCLHACLIRAVCMPYILYDRQAIHSLIPFLVL